MFKTIFHNFLPYNPSRNPSTNPPSMPMTKSKSSSRSNRKSLYQFQSTTTTFYHHNSDSPKPKKHAVSIPIQTTNNSQILTESAAAVKIQSTYRAHLIRSLTSTIRSVNSEAEKLQRTIQQQETVDLIRRNERERLRVNEALMRLLLKLDSVRGLDPAVRELRKSVSRKIVGLQEVVDAVAAAVEVNGGGSDEGCWEFVRRWEEDLAAIEGEVCRERGGREMERFCVDKLGFVCFQRFLRGDA